jgi:hypothetical protein
VSNWFENDDDLLGEVGQALAESGRAAGGPDPDRAGTDRVEMLLVGYDMVMADRVAGPSQVDELIDAILVEDSAADDLVAVRADTDARRLLTFTVDGAEVELEVSGGRVSGQIDPPPTGPVVIEQPAAAVAFGPDAGSFQVEADQFGAFEFELSHPGSFRLLMVLDGRRVAVGWVDGPHPTSG